MPALPHHHQRKPMIFKDTTIGPLETRFTWSMRCDRCGTPLDWLVAASCKTERSEVIAVKFLRERARDGGSLSEWGELDLCPSCLSVMNA
ncbi:Protein of unknown function [Propionibacterium freudenreichii]|nr:Protein of unknown function [Propionibacterium freudenreichii]